VSLRTWTKLGRLPEGPALIPTRHDRSLPCRRRGPSVACCIGVFAAVVLITGLAAPTWADVGPAGEWVDTGPTAPPTGNNPNFGTLVTLPGGSALLVGNPIQRYTPSTGSWALAGVLLGNGGVVTVLSNGKVLVTGLSPAEVYDPATQTSTVTGAMVTPRSGHQATLLSSGDVLVSGGADAQGKLIAPTERYRSYTGTWTITGTMNNPRTRHTGLLLLTGKVLVAGGVATSASLTSAELYDPLTGRWTFTSDFSGPCHGSTACSAPSEGSGSSLL